MVHIFLLGHGTMDEHETMSEKVSHKVLFYAPQGCTTSPDILSVISEENYLKTDSLTKGIIIENNSISFEEPIPKIPNKGYPFYEKEFREHYWSCTQLDSLFVQTPITYIRKAFKDTKDKCYIGLLKSDSITKICKYPLSRVIEILDDAKIGGEEGYIIHWSICRAIPNSRPYWKLKPNNSAEKKTLLADYMSDGYSKKLKIEEVFKLIDYTKLSANLSSDNIHIEGSLENDNGHIFYLMDVEKIKFEIPSNTKSKKNSPIDEKRKFQKEC